MNTDADRVYDELNRCLRKASIAKIGGFRPPDDKTTSWFGGRGVGFPGEVLPTYKGKEMFPLLQARIEELPFVPAALGDTKFLVVFFNRDELPFDQPHGQGWEIREYTSLEDLAELPIPAQPSPIRGFPIQWSLVEDDATDWENAWELVDLTPIVDADDERFFEEYNRYPCTKFGGFPCCIQHGHELDGFVFQIGSEDKPGWMWADNGIAYFNKDDQGTWKWNIQFY